MQIVRALLTTALTLFALFIASVWVMSGGLMRLAGQEQRPPVVVENDTDYSACRAITDDSKNLECLFTVAAGEGLTHQ